MKKWVMGPQETGRIPEKTVMGRGSPSFFVFRIFFKVDILMDKRYDF